MNADRAPVFRSAFFDGWKWSQRRYSKPRPPLYESGALPLELLRRNLERARRIELRLPDRRSGAQPMGHTRKLWSGRKYTTPACIQHSIVKDQAGPFTHTLRPFCFQRKASPPFPQGCQQKQKGQPFSVAALLETGILFQDGQVTARASVLTHSHVPEGSLLNWNKCFTHLKRIRTLVEIQAFS